MATNEEMAPDHVALEMYAEGLKVSELRELARVVGVRHVWQSRKDELVAKLVTYGPDVLRRHRDEK